VIILLRLADVALSSFTSPSLRLKLDYNDIIFTVAD
jgi:hypothetical protein